MVYAAAYCPVSYKDTLKTLSFADSKVLTPQIRSDLLEQLCSPSSDHLFNSVGWSARIMTASDISAAMLSPIAYNLNAQAHDTTIALIRNEEVWGSGYPSDPRTAKWLKGESMDKVFGWSSDEVRYSWSTTRELLEKSKDCVKVDWHDDDTQGMASITSFFGDTGKTASSRWYGPNVLASEF